jgi:hypothetical protein
MFVDLFLAEMASYLIELRQQLLVKMCTPVIPAPRRLRPEDHLFEASLGYLRV